MKNPRTPSRTCGGTWIFSLLGLLSSPSSIQIMTTTEPKATINSNMALQFFHETISASSWVSPNRIRQL